MEYSAHDLEKLLVWRLVYAPGIVGPSATSSQLAPMLITTFIRQKPYEHIVLTVRRNFITFIPTLLGSFVLYALPVAVAWLLARVAPEFVLLPTVYPALVLAASLFYLFSLLLFLTFFVDFYLDLLIVTNDRLIRVSQHGMFSRSIFEVDLYQIQDATSSVHGAWASWFRYGNVTIEAVGSEPKCIAQNVSHPDELRQRILELAQADKQYHKPQAITGTPGQR